MKQETRFRVLQGWKLLLADMDVNPADVLALAGLPQDLFVQTKATLSADGFFTLWESLEKVAGETELPLKIGQAISVEAFDPPIFASLCSPNLDVALRRLSTFKKLIGPLALNVDSDASQTSVTLACTGKDQMLPRSLAASEMVFLTKLARLGTRQDIVPREVVLSHELLQPDLYRHYFGIPVQPGNSNHIVFSAEDAQRPFLTENVRMWESFEPELKKRLSDLETGVSTTQRVKSALLEMLPGGETSMEQAASRLAMSRRSLQRHLAEEGQKYQTILQATRQQLAQHYLGNSSMSPGEISFLLGFQDSNSFIRAYSNWTGETPGQFRAAAAGRN